MPSVKILRRQSLLGYMNLYPWYVLLRKGQQCRCCCPSCIVLPITSILGRLPVVWAGDTGTIPVSYRDSCCNGTHCYNQDLAKADTSPGVGDCCPLYFVNSWALGWSRDLWDWNEVRTLLHIITYYYISTDSTHYEGSIVVPDL